MSTSNSATPKGDLFAPPPASIWVRIGQDFDRFFFRPADPTTLGVMRICCGLIAFYTVFAWGMDLQELFGRHAWVDLETRNEWRVQFPNLRAPFSFDNVPPPDYAKEKEMAREEFQRGGLNEAAYNQKIKDLEERTEYAKKWGTYKELTISQGQPLWSVWFHVTDPAAMLAVHYCIMGIVFLFLIGFCTRVTSALTWVAVLSYIHRSPTSVFGVDTMMSIGLLYLMIGPSGAALSVDRLIQRWWVTYRALRNQRLAGGKSVPLPALPLTSSVGANLAYRLLQIHVCIIYGAAGLAKLQGRSWWTGEAVWGTLANFDLSPMQYPIYYDFLKFLSDNPVLWELFMTGGTIFTLIFEIGFPFLVWNPRTRWVYVGMAVVLHGGIGLFMGLKTFSLMMLTLVISFTPPDLWKRLLGHLSRGPTGLRLYYPAQGARSVRAASLVRALDVHDQVALVAKEPAPLALGEPAGLVLTLPDGREFRGLSLWLRLVRSLGLFRFFLPWNVFTYRQPGEQASLLPPMSEEASEELGRKPAREAVKSTGIAVRKKR